MKVLLVEDDDAFRDSVKTLLLKAGYAVAEASNGEAAKSHFASERFDLVISDVRMPVMNGIELLRFIQGTVPTPVVFITGFSEIMQTQEAYQLGVKEILSKPFKSVTLLQAVKKHAATQ